MMSDTDPLPDYYAVLSVPPTATLAEIEAAFRRRAARSHPDRGGTHAQMVMINAAGETLTDPEKRAAYDADRARRHAATGGAETSRTDSAPTDRPVTTPLTPLWNRFVDDFLKADYVRAPWLGWPPKIENSQSGAFFTVIGGFAGVGLMQLLQITATPERYTRLLTAFTNLLMFLLVGPAAGAVLHWFVRQCLQKLSPGENPD